MPQRNVATNFTFEQQRQEINLLAADFWTHKGDTDTAAPTYLKHDGSNAFSGQTLAVPNAFTINANSGGGTVTISGNLDVTGTTTTVSSANLEVTDKNILIAKGSTSDAQADGAGITIDSATDITFNFVDAKDALVSSIGLEGTTFLKAPYGHFIGSGVPSGGQGVEINAPDTNTGQIISYDRANTAYKQLNIKGSSVGIYGGTSNALIGSFSSTGLSMESGKTITGVLATAAQPNITSLGTLTGLTIENTLSTNGRASAHGYICRDNYGAATGIGNGMYSPGVNTLGFATNSVERLTLTGDTSYSSFTLKRSATTNQNAVFYYDANYLDIETRESTGIRLKTNQGNRLIITSTGKVEIDGELSVGSSIGINGSGGSAYPLHVYSGQKYLVGLKNSSANSGIGYPWLVNDTSQGGQNSLIVHFNGIGDRFFVRENGSVSTIGDLQVGTDTAHSGARITADGNIKLTQATSNTRRIFALPGTGAYALNSSGGAAIGFTRDANNNDFLMFETHTQGASHAERMRLTYEGYLHLGGVSQGTNKVGGTSVTGNDFDPIFKLLTQTQNSWLMQLRSDTSTGPNGIFMRAGNASTNYTMYLTGTDENNPHLIVRGDGQVTTPAQCGFTARMSSNFSHPGNNSFNSGTNWVMPFDQEVWDVGANFNVSNYTFTAPVTGRYLCCYTIQLEAISGWVWNYIYPVVTGTGGTNNTSASTAAGVIFADDGGAGVTGNTQQVAQYRIDSKTFVLNLTAGQEVRMGIRGEMSATIKSATETQWQMQLLA